MKIGDGAAIDGQGPVGEFDPVAKVAEFMAQHKKGEVEPAAEPVEEPVVETIAEEPAGKPEEEPVAEPKPAGRMAIPRDVKVAGVETPPAEESEPAPEVDPEAPPEAQVPGKGRDKWASLKRTNKDLTTANADLKRKLEQATAELEQARTAGEATREVETLRAQLGEAEEKLAKYDITQSRTFREQFETPYKQKLQRAAGLLARAGLEQNVVNDTLRAIADPSAPIAVLEESLADLPRGVQAPLILISQELAELATARDEALNNWRETQAAVAEQDARSVSGDLSREASSLVSDAVAVLRDENSWMFSDSEDTAWMRQRTQMVNAATSLLKTAKPAELAKYVLEGVAARAYRTWGEGLHADYEALKAEVKKRLGTIPRVGAGGGVNAEAEAAEARKAAEREAKESKGKPISPEDWLQKQLKR